jgi:hypothetical protein
VVRTLTPTTADAVCGALPTIELRARPVDQDVTVNPGTVDLGDFFCNSSPNTTKPIAIANYSPGSATIDIALQATTWFTATPSSQPVAAAPATPGASTPGTITIGLKNPLGSDLGSHVETATVTITTDPPQPNPTRTITLRADIFGAKLEITPAELNGFQPDQTRAFDVRNVGNAFTFVQYTGSGGGFSLEGDDGLYPITDLRGLGQQISIQFTAQSGGSYTANVTAVRASSPFTFPPYPESAPLCTPAPTVQAKATR